MIEDAIIDWVDDHSGACTDEEAAKQIADLYDDDPDYILHIIHELLELEAIGKHIDHDRIVLVAIE